MFSLESIYRAGFVAGLLSLAVFMLGHLGLLAAPYLMASVLTAVVLFTVLSVQASFSASRPEKAEPFKRFEKFLTAFAVVLVLAIVPLAVAPPTVRDELIQHLAVPKLYLAHGSIYEIPFMGFSYLPQNIDMLYLVSLGLGSDTGARLTHLAFAVLTALLVYRYLQPEIGRTYSLLAFCLYISTPVVFNLARVAYVDHGSAFYSTLALVAALKWKNGDGPRWMAYSAVALGFAAGAKFNTLLTLFLLTVFFFAVSLRNSKKLSPALRSAVLVSLAAAVLVSPWLARNWLWTGSPFYPLYEVAASASASGPDMHVMEGLAPAGKRLLMYGENLLDIILVPLRIFWEGRDNSIEKFDGVLNPIYLFFIAAAFFFRASRQRFSSDLKLLVLFTIMYFYLAFFTVDIVTRYLLPVIPAVVIFVTLGIKRLVDTDRLKGIAVTFALMLFAVNILYIFGLYLTFSPVRYLVGSETRDEYLSRMLSDYTCIMYANEHLPKDATVMLLFTGERGYYWERDYRYGDRLGGLFKSYISSSVDSKDIKMHFTRAGIDHLFINERLFEKFVHDNFKGARVKMLVDFFQQDVEKLYASNGYTLYALK